MLEKDGLESSRFLSDEEEFFLARGSNFSVPPGKLDYVDFRVSFELHHRKVRDDIIAPKSKPGHICKNSVKEHFSKWSTQLQRASICAYCR